jgi:hypothetical protein
MKHPISTPNLPERHHQLIERNALQEGMTYLQISRGNPGDRDFMYPSDEADVMPAVVGSTFIHFRYWTPRRIFASLPHFDHE